MRSRYLWEYLRRQVHIDPRGKIYALDVQAAAALIALLQFDDPEMEMRKMLKLFEIVYIEA